MKKQPRQYDDDDGRVICSMDVDGMRWHDRRIRREQRDERRSRRPVPPGEMMTRSEARLYTWYAVLAALTIVAVFSVTWVLFTLFLTEVWFR
jgi:hypothetical protein